MSSNVLATLAFSTSARKASTDVLQDIGHLAEAVSYRLLHLFARGGNLLVAAA